MMTIGAQPHAESWYASKEEGPVFPVLEGEEDVETVVVGGGLAGITTAFCLARMGKSVALLEANRVGWGASGRNGGFVSPGYAQSIFAVEAKLGLPKARALFNMGRAGTQFVAERLDEFGLQHLVGGRGWLKCVRYPAEDALKERAERMARDYGVHYQVWPREAVRETLQTDRYFGALHDPEPFHLDPLAYSRALSVAAADSGARIYEASPATGLSRESGGWRVTTPKGALRARHVVLAGNATQVGLYPPLEHAVLPVSTYVVTSEPLGDRLDRAIHFSGCIGDTRRSSDYYRIVGSGDDRRLLWGGRITTARSEPKELARMLTRDILSIYPQLGAFRIEYAWAGLMGYQRNKMPVIGLLAGARDAGLWGVTAFGGHGMGATATGGNLIAAAIATGDESWRAFEPFLPAWIDRLVGGRNIFGQAATQLVYWQLRLMDRWQESRGKL
ncbi:FAD-binding oxidoreductase [Afifella sp. JA880]|uniref:NAD(P)/FAD-dependent oxidoreductase n=1 Tax=Afifella sp. JA880 TaxID=2975280 RepID=UPI0021BB4F16|nr:FAD-dependent oxidoreductase [Afifella sp. JA880]MCT8267349.1 FAD-binding oxidoreductase [Afifella sp. JA880]